MTPEELLDHASELPEPLKGAVLAMVNNECGSNLGALRRWHGEEYPLATYRGYQIAVLETLSQQSGYTLREIGGALSATRAASEAG